MAILDIQSAYDHLAQKIKDYINKYTVKTVNGVGPDSNGNVKINISSGSGGSTVSLTPKITQGVNIADITINGSTTKLYSPDYKNKTAVVFGDSMLNNPSVGYEFGDWLVENSNYKTVYNHAYEGSGFGNTYQYRRGYSLYELLHTTSGKTPDGKTSYADIQNHVREADVIYIHLGGNDVISQTSKWATPLTETDVYTKTKACLDKIATLNPNAIIYYTPFFRLADLALIKSTMVPSMFTEGQQFVDGVKRIYNVRKAVADTEANVFVNELYESTVAYKLSDDMHPTVECAEALFDRILNGRYISKYIQDFLFISTNNIVVEEYLNYFVSSINSGKVYNSDITLVLVAFDAGVGWVNISKCYNCPDPYKILFTLDLYNMGGASGITRMAIGVDQNGNMVQHGYLISSQQLA